MNSPVKFRSRDEFILHVIRNGFAKAAISFSQFIDKPVTISNNQSVLVHAPSGFSYTNQESGSLFVLTTRLLGPLSGTSILILSEAERETILKAGEKWQIKDYSDPVKRALFVEIANIISASVITELSNELNIEIFGDVPEIKETDAAELGEFVTACLAEIPGTEFISSSVLIMSSAFIIDQAEHIHPQFLWKLDPRIFEKVPENYLTSHEYKN